MKLSRNKTLSSRLLAKCLMNKHLQLTNISTILDPLRSHNTERNHIFDYAPRTNTDNSFTIIRESGRTYSRFNT
uniref:Uncharacterized protein n=1 Tax=Timema tahoe TaxID=61484 RepID=A0A7R9ITX8_9NEOP|nr:unnamed protein product [Timema tahoe]